MKKIFILLTAVFLSSLSQGQSLKRVKVFCTDSFNIKAAITVTRLSNDPLLVVDALKNNLVEAGFKVISERVAKERIELSNKGERTDSTFSQDISLGKTTYVKSVYVATITYNWNEYNALTDLQGQIVDLASDGEIVATFSFRQSGAVPVRKPIEITKVIAENLKRKQNK
jgi:hypothetical protein